MTAVEERHETRDTRHEIDRSCLVSRVSCLLSILVAVWTVAHIGCHSDEDTELGVTPPTETRTTAGH
jgi:hypothetical protein